MGLASKTAQWWPVAILVVLSVVAALDMTGSLGPVYRWLHDHVSPEGWSALAAWATVLIAFGAAVFAWFQVREARRTREEQAQPNVVIYSELNPAVKQFIEIVVKNFGTTPAYHVKVSVTPPLTSTPNSLSGDNLYEIPIPEFLILAPGQEWRTGWDHSVTRKRYQDKWNRLAKTMESERTDSEKLEREYWTTRQEDETTPEQRLQERFLPTRYKASVVYEDSRGKSYETEALLDSDQYKGTTWVDIKTMHDLTKMLDKHLKEHVKGLEAIHRRLVEFNTEHEGIWIYGSGDEDERQYRRKVAAAEAAADAEDDRLFEEAIGVRVRQNPAAEETSEETNGENGDEPDD
ncbi:hypothetical protein [Mycolicibacterium tusciae]|uniref:hypothetical protein n=1 Tax=Mycolicibacterium tusciae TaxID=75922 RepID=UPI00024A16BD|nr:hypothetical protein [Mycolicibacterium tusciae]